MPNIYVKVPYNVLLSLVASDIRLDALDRAGVENWSMYGCNFSELTQAYIEECRDMFELEKRYYSFNEVADIFIQKCDIIGLFEIIEEE